MTRSLRIDRDRLWASLMELKEIGAYNVVLRLADQP
jgi:hypothetical protein